MLAACGGRPTVTGTVEIAGAPHAGGVVVRVLDGTGASAVTAEDGRFSFEPGATLLLTAEAVTPRSVTLVRAQAGAAVRFTAVGTLSGTARKGGAAKGNASVAVSVADPSGAHGAVADSGAYALEVPAGRHVVTANAAGYAEARSTEVVVARGGTTEVPPLILPLIGYGFTGGLAGKVLKAGTERHAGVEVLVEGAGRTTVTAEDGTFALTDVPEGSYTVVFSYDGLTERVPNVVVTRGADGYLVDQSLYRLAEKPIVLMAGTRIDSGRMTLSPVRPPFATWIAWDLLQTQSRVHWADAAKDVAHDAGKVSNYYSSERTSPQLSPDGTHVVWAPNDGTLRATSTATGETRVVGHNYRRPIGWEGARQFNPISAGGQIAYEGYVDGNRDALMIAPLMGDGTSTRVAHAWPDSAAQVYGARFYGEALVAITDVDEYTGALRWWKPGEPERTLSQGAYASSFTYADHRRYFEIADRWHTTYDLFDLETGQRLLTRSAGNNGLFSADQKFFAWSEPNATRLLELGTMTQTKLADTGTLTPVCVLGSLVVATTYSGTVVALSGGQSVTLAGPSLVGTYRQYAKCGDGYVYWTEYTTPDYQRMTLYEQKLTGGTPVALATGNIAGYSLEIRDGQVWFMTGARNLNNATYGTLWVAAQGSGAPAVVHDDVRLYPKLLFPSPTGAHHAFVANDGLYVFEAGAAQPKPRRIATGVDDVQWIADDQLVFTMPPPAAPFSFQGGVYFARPYR